MSEFEPRFEKRKSAELSEPEFEELREHSHERLDRDAEKAQAEHKKRVDSLEAIQESINNTARSSQEMKREALAENQDLNASEKSLPANRQLRKHSGRQELKRVQKQLPRSERVFSKVVHQPVVNAVSTAAEVTVARPSGLLFGAIFSVIGSLVVLYICKHYGYEYNFMIGMACFVGGFALGLLLEGLYRLVRRP